MENILQKEMDDSLFEFAKKAVRKESGDGTVLIVCGNDYKQLALEFAKRENKKKVHYAHTSASEGNETFSLGSQEAIIFARTLKIEDAEFYDTVIILNTY